MAARKSLCVVETIASTKHAVAAAVVQSRLVVLNHPRHLNANLLAVVAFPQVAVVADLFRVVETEMNRAVNDLVRVVAIEPSRAVDEARKCVTDIARPPRDLPLRRVINKSALNAQIIIMLF
jgi:hypothetical protein